MDIRKSIRKLRKDKGLKRLKRKAKRGALLGLNKVGEGTGRVATKGTVALAKLAERFPKSADRVAKAANKLPKSNKQRSNKKLNEYEKAFYWGAAKGIGKESVNQVKKAYKKR